MGSFFLDLLQQADPDVFSAVGHELKRQQNQLELIASENIVSRAVLEAQGSVLTNKYAEGYSGRRYYQGCDYIDVVETLAIERAKKLFHADYVNVQPHSGAQANMAVLFALLEPGDTLLGMALNAGGHLTHGAGPALSGQWFKAVQYGVRRDDHLIDFDQVASLAREHKPKLIIAGASAYARVIDFDRFRAIADEVGAYLMVDMAHIAGLVAGGVHPNPVPVADIVTTTTHKTLRGPRGGMILSRDLDLGKKINSAVFPGIQGGPLMHVIAAKAVALKEALDPSFKDYARQVVHNAQTLASALQEKGVDLVTGGTDNHMLLVDLRSQKLTGKQVDMALERAGITCNKNAVPFDEEKPTITSGIRLGSPALTTRGFKASEFQQVAQLIWDVMDALKIKPDGDFEVERRVREDVKSLCKMFPIYNELC